ncbi:hypothetical protein TPS_04531 [Trichinella pseudospiralis]
MVTTKSPADRYGNLSPPNRANLGRKRMFASAVCGVNIVQKLLYRALNNAAAASQVRTPPLRTQAAIPLCCAHSLCADLACNTAI